MQKELEEKLTQLKASNLVDPDVVAGLYKMAKELKDTSPRDALNIFRTIAMATDNVRLFTTKEKLAFFGAASELGWTLGEPKWHFDRRTAELYRDQDNLDMAGFQYERAAKSFIMEGTANHIASIHDWKIQGHMLREARMCYEAAGSGADSSRCFIEYKKLLRDNAETRQKKIIEWSLYVFWSWGESPLKVAIWGSVVIGLFALSYCVTGMMASSGEITHDLLEAFYLSIITFTTLGYGDLTPTSGIGRFFAASEALSGIFFTGLFLVTFVKRFSR